MTHPTIGTVAMGDTEEQFIKDAIRSGYDRGYNDARNAKSVPGDNARGYRGRDMSDEIATDVLARLRHNVAALSTRPAQEPVAWGNKLSLSRPKGGVAWERIVSAEKRPSYDVPLYAAPQPVLSQPEVKALEWIDGVGLSYAQTNVVACYSVWDVEDGLWLCSLVDGQFPTIEAAKAAAQADYEQRILSALCPLSDIPAQAGKKRVKLPPIGDELYEHYAVMSAQTHEALVKDYARAVLAANVSEGSTDE